MEKVPHTEKGNPLAVLTRRGLFAGAAGCLGCARGILCAPQESGQAAHSWAEKADLTWEEIFRFAYQKDLIPMLKAISEQVGREKFVQMIKDAGDAVVQKKTAGMPPAVRDLVMLAASARKMPPVMQHALEPEIVEETPDAFEYRVKK
jgi:hypothetical protein